MSDERTHDPAECEARERGVEIIGFGDENDSTTYPIKAGGMQIMVNATSLTKGRRPGTLGCFARRTTPDKKIVVLSNHHVLMPREFFDNDPSIKDVGVGVGQPAYRDYCCCVCDDIGTVIKGNKTLDCAIAEIKSDLKFARKIRTIKRGDGTVELSGVLNGSEDGAEGDEVWKVGARTGLTRGTITKIENHVMTITPLPPYDHFADHGDSGSVVVKASTSKVVGLLRKIDQEGGALGFAITIAPIKAIMEIEILQTEAGETELVAGYEEEWSPRAVRPVAPAEVFASMAERLGASERGRDTLALFRRHADELSELVNHRRPVTVAWHRSQGPTYLAAVMRSVREPAYRLPEALNGVTRREAFARLREALTRSASEPLRADLEAHAETLTRAWLGGETTEELLLSLEQGGHAA